MNFLTLLENGIQDIKQDFTESQLPVLLEKAVTLGGRVYVVANGGSAGLASHFATDLSKTFKIATAVFHDPGILTCFANDYGYDLAARKWLDINVDTEKDLVVGISSSGNSQNIVEVASFVIENGCDHFFLTGFLSNNRINQIIRKQNRFWVQSEIYNVVENLHTIYLLNAIEELIRQGNSSQ